jgi:PAS domain S-box-containing protein
MSLIAPEEGPTADPVSAILDDLGVVVLVSSLEGRLISVCGAVTSRFGYLPKELVGKELRTLVSPESTKLFDEKLRQQLFQPVTYLITVLTKTGSRIRVHVTTALLRDRGRPIGLAAILHPALEPEPPKVHPSWLTLTPRQHEILVLLSHGLSTDEIARRLTVQRDTVRNHIRALLRTLGSHSRLEAVVKARRAGLI